jgi:hypothetical protein
MDVMTAAIRTPSARLVILRRAAVALLALGAASTLAGCSATPPAKNASTVKAGSGSSPGTSQNGSGSGAGGSSPSATPTGGAGVLESTPFSMPCDTLAPPATVSSTYSGMSALSKPSPPHDSDAAVIGEYGGTVCSWKNTSGTTMTLAVGKFSPISLTKLKNSLVVSSNQVPTYQGEGYFTLSGTTGTAEAFTGDFWVVATSADPIFGEPGGAEPLVDGAITALKSAG